MTEIAQRPCISIFNFLLLMYFFLLMNKGKRKAFRRAPKVRTWFDTSLKGLFTVSFRTICASPGLVSFVLAYYLVVGILGHNLESSFDNTQLEL